MHDAHASAIFGLDPLWLATTVMIITYGVIISERLNRSIIALLGAMLMIMFGLLTQEQAVAGIDFNTIGLLVGMMIIVSITRKCGVFEYLAIWSAKLVKASPAGILAMLAVVTAIVSAYPRQRHDGATRRSSDADHHRVAQASIPIRFCSRRSSRRTSVARRP